MTPTQRCGCGCLPLLHAPTHQAGLSRRRVRPEGPCLEKQYSARSAWWTEINTPHLPGVTTSALRAADFNGDGRADIFRIADTATGYKWHVSYSGTEPWSEINTSGIALSLLRFADFDGDGRADVFRMNSSGWWVSYSGTSGWSKLRDATPAGEPMVVGDVDGNGRDDFMMYVPYVPVP